MMNIKSKLPTDLLIDGQKYHTGEIDPDNLPKHIAIIMDGNGRWAKQKFRPRTFGHYAGAEVLRTIVKAADAIGIKAISAYAFSTENWKRPKLEVDILMNLIDKYLDKELDEFSRNNVRVVFSGDLSALPDSLKKKMLQTLQTTKTNTGLVLNLAINYGSRAEIIHAVQKICSKVQAGELEIEQLDEEAFSTYLYTNELPDVDLLIRPGGDLRISNFLLWQIAYAEIWVTEAFWPEFNPQLFIQAIADYQQRDRRFGGLNKK